MYFLTIEIYVDLFDLPSYVGNKSKFISDQILSTGVDLRRNPVSKGYQIDKLITTILLSVFRVGTTIQQFKDLRVSATRPNRFSN